MIKDKIKKILDKHALWSSHKDNGERANLKEILDKHALWFDHKDSGERADLSDANLRGADLSGAHLRGADLSGDEIYYRIQEGLLKQIAD